MKTLFLFSAVLFPTLACAQSPISITIDDVPNTKHYQADGFQHSLLAVLDSLQVPAAIFINESYLFGTDAEAKNLALLKSWVEHPLVTLGNHSYSHARYSATGFEGYREEVWKGEATTRALAEKGEKSLSYFRFPYNDMGADAAQQDSIKQFLEDEGYKLTPFTIENSDWIFSALYENHLQLSEHEKAKELMEQYIRFTLQQVDFFEAESHTQYQRDISQILLIHDTRLNRHCLPKILEHLQERGNRFIPLEDALTDPVYAQQEHYRGKWGYSWLYRWMEDEGERKKLMQKEPSVMPYYKAYQALGDR